MPAERPDRADVVAMPPVIVAAALAIGLLLQLTWPVRFMPRSYALASGVGLIAVALAILAGAVWRLSMAETALDVRKPTTGIVTGGVFRFSRNPIYLSMMLGFLGVAVLTGSLWLLLLALPLMAILQNGVIKPEERYLERKFGAQYLSYKVRVRRWV